MTGVQTCALPICIFMRNRDEGDADTPDLNRGGEDVLVTRPGLDVEIGRASCRERV